MRVAAISAAVLALVVFLLAGAAALWGYRQFNHPGPLTAPTTAVIAKGSGLGSISRQLAEAGIIREPLVFRLGVRLEGQAAALQAGEYEFPATITPREVMELLVSGRTVQRRFTVAEGLSTGEILSLLEDVEGLKGGISSTPGEGELLPDTYYFSMGDTRDAVLERMRTAMHDAVDRLWESRAADLPIETKEEAVILASIVEKETAVPEERPRVAAVFVNRLRRGMRLQSDPTVIYGMTQGPPLDRPLLIRDLERKTPYNTYQIDGLPPGPIANPGLESLAAVLNPADTADLYFVADGSGGHAFAATLEEHNRNVARWRKIQRQQKN